MEVVTKLLWVNNYIKKGNKSEQQAGAGFGAL